MKKNLFNMVEALINKDHKAAEKELHKHLVDGMRASFVTEMDMDDEHMDGDYDDMDDEHMDGDYDDMDDEHMDGDYDDMDDDEGGCGGKVKIKAKRMPMDDEESMEREEPGMMESDDYDDYDEEMKNKDRLKNKRRKKMKKDSKKKEGMMEGGEYEEESGKDMKDDDYDDDKKDMKKDDDYDDDKKDMKKKKDDLCDDDNPKDMKDVKGKKDMDDEDKKLDEMASMMYPKDYARNEKGSVYHSVSHKDNSRKYKNPVKGKRKGLKNISDGHPSPDQDGKKINRRTDKTKAYHGRSREGAKI